MGAGGRILIIGGGAAGMSAAASARRIDGSCEIIVIEKGDFVSTVNCGIPYYLSGLIEDIRQLAVYSPEYFRQERNIQVITGTEATEIDPLSHRVSLWNRVDHTLQKISYDSLVIATGGHPVVPPVPGIDAHNVFTLRTVDDAIRLRSFLECSKVDRVAVLGGGWSGILMCETLACMGTEVTLLEKGTRILPGFDREITDQVEKRLRHEGISIYKDFTLERLVKDAGGKVCSLVSGGMKMDTGLVIAAIGVYPSSELFYGLEKGSAPGKPIETDERMKTGRDGIFACGDCTSALHLVLNRPVYRPLGTTANRQGAVAGENAAGRFALFTGILGTQAMKIFDLELARTGLSGEEARAHGFRIIEVTTTSSSRAQYIPGGSPVTTKVIVEKDTARLLGAQMIGTEAIAKRVDIFVPMLHNRMTLHQSVDLDLTYTPRCSPLWDPVLHSLREALKSYQQKADC